MTTYTDAVRLEQEQPGIALEDLQPWLVKDNEILKFSEQLNSGILQHKVIKQIPCTLKHLDSIQHVKQILFIPHQTANENSLLRLQGFSLSTHPSECILHPEKKTASRPHERHADPTM